MRKHDLGLVAVALLMFSACSAGFVDGAPSNLPTITSTSLPEQPEGSILVRATGPLVEHADGTLELCAGVGDGCAGIPLTGEVTTPDGDAPVVAVTGWYDGTRLQVIDLAIPDGSQFGNSDFSTPCEGLRGQATGNPADGPVNAVADYTATIPDRYAGRWWDGSSGVMTVWLTGDDIEVHRLALEEAAGDSVTLCVIGGADYSEERLLAVQAEILDVIDLQMTAVWATSVDTLSNRVDVMMEYLDAPTRDSVAARFGSAVVFQAFLEVLDGTIADLPAHVPARPGNVELLTQPNRASGGMDALGTFRLEFDEDRGCVYFAENETGTGGRTVPVWPFGYTADADPLRVYDQDGELVAEEGDLIQMGGGFVDSAAGEPCGSRGAWIMSSRPEIVDP